MGRELRRGGTFFFLLPAARPGFHTGKWRSNGGDQEALGDWGELGR